MPRQKSTHVDSPAAVGERLKVAREKAGLSQRQLSFPGCSPAYISRIESGDRIPSLQLLRELGRQLGVSEDYLATGSEIQGEPGGALVEAEVALTVFSPSDANHPDLADSLGRSYAMVGELESAIGVFERYRESAAQRNDTFQTI